MLPERKESQTHLLHPVELICGEICCILRRLRCPLGQCYDLPVARLVFERLAVRLLCLLVLAHARERATDAQVTLGPLRSQLDALLSILERLV